MTYANAVITSISYNGTSNPLEVAWSGVYGDNATFHGSTGGDVNFPIGTSLAVITAAVQTACAMAAVGAGYSLLPDDVVVLV